MTYRVNRGLVHAILVDVAADGQSLQLAARDTTTAGDDAAAAFGTATTVAAAFNRFWGPRDDVGQRAASLVFRKTDAVSDALTVLIAADGDMSAGANSALERVPASYRPPASGRRGLLMN